MEGLHDKLILNPRTGICQNGSYIIACDSLSHSYLKNDRALFTWNSNREPHFPTPQGPSASAPLPFLCQGGELRHQLRLIEVVVRVCEVYNEVQ